MPAITSNITTSFNSVTPASLDTERPDNLNKIPGQSAPVSYDPTTRTAEMGISSDYMRFTLDKDLQGGNKVQANSSATTSAVVNSSNSTSTSQADQLEKLLDLAIDLIKLIVQQLNQSKTGMQNGMSKAAGPTANNAKPPMTMLETSPQVLDQVVNLIDQSGLISRPKQDKPLRPQDAIAGLIRESIKADPKLAAKAAELYQTLPADLKPKVAKQTIQNLSDQQLIEFARQPQSRELLQRFITDLTADPSRKGNINQAARAQNAINATLTTGEKTTQLQELVSKLTELLNQLSAQLKTQKPNSPSGANPSGVQKDGGPRREKPNNTSATINAQLIQALVSLLMILLTQSQQSQAEQAKLSLPKPLSA
ncbi:MAG: hypothetical protein AB1489_26005 [Acidobacteriota bacterium]